MTQAEKILNYIRENIVFYNNYKPQVGRLDVSIISKNLHISMDEVNNSLQKYFHSQTFTDTGWQVEPQINFRLFLIFFNDPPVDSKILNIFVPETKKQLKNRVKESFIVNDWILYWILEMLASKTTLFTTQEKNEIFLDLKEYLEARLSEKYLNITFVTLESFIRVLRFSEVFIDPKDPSILNYLKDGLKEIENKIIFSIKKRKEEELEIFQKKIGCFNFLDHLESPQFFLSKKPEESLYYFPYQLKRLKSLLGRR